MADAWPLITPPADSSPLDHTHLATSGAGLSLRPPVYPSQAPTLQEPVGPSRLRTGVDRKRARPGRSPERTRTLVVGLMSTWRQPWDQTKTPMSTLRSQRKRRGDCATSTLRAGRYTPATLRLD